MSKKPEDLSMLDRMTILMLMTDVEDSSSDWSSAYFAKHFDGKCPDYFCGCDVCDVKKARKEAKEALSFVLGEKDDARF
jgi:hypothetical protein